MAAKRSDAPAIPFDTDRLDRLMDEAGMDVLVACSKHNVQYLLGGHRAFFFDTMDAMGLSRYLPVVVYPKGAPDKAAYIGHRLETHQREVKPFWTPEVQTSSNGSVDAMTRAIDHIRKSGVKAGRIGAELAFLPARHSPARSATAPSRMPWSCWSGCARSRVPKNCRNSASRPTS
jgi:Xaa-Pro aminopeptidase